MLQGVALTVETSNIGQSPKKKRILKISHFLNGNRPLVALLLKRETGPHSSVAESRGVRCNIDDEATEASSSQHVVRPSSGCILLQSGGETDLFLSLIG